jgi:peptidoglycan/xylan/chitin deacetylase (PgdA/CDA1 family)
MTSLALPPPKPWRPTPFLWASLVLHVAAVLAVIVDRSWWPWALAAVVANHAAITIAGLLPRCGWLGRTITALPPEHAARGEWALTIDDGPDADVTPKVLDILEAHGARATFFCIGERVRAHPELVARIVARGHDVQNHSEVHAHGFSTWGTRRIEAELKNAQETIARAAGTAPRFFRAPAGLRNIFLAPVLHRLGLELVAWTARGFDTRERDARRVLARLRQGLRGGAILLLHDGHAARGDDGKPVVLDVLPRLLDEARAQGLRTVTLTQAWS